MQSAFMVGVGNRKVCIDYSLVIDQLLSLAPLTRGQAIDAAVKCCKRTYENLKLANVSDRDSELVNSFVNEENEGQFIIGYRAYLNLFEITHLEVGRAPERDTLGAFVVQKGGTLRATRIRKSPDQTVSVFVERFKSYADRGSLELASYRGNTGDDAADFQDAPHFARTFPSLIVLLTNLVHAANADCRLHAAESKPYAAKNRFGELPYTKTRVREVAVPPTQPRGLTTVDAIRVAGDWGAGEQTYLLLTAAANAEGEQFGLTDDGSATNGKGICSSRYGSATATNRGMLSTTEQAAFCADPERRDDDHCSLDIWLEPGNCVKPSTSDRPTSPDWCFLIQAGINYVSVDGPRIDRH